MGSVNDLFRRVLTALAFMPDPLAGLVLMLLAALAAVFLHKLAIRLVRRALRGERHDYLRNLLMRTRGPSRLAFLIVFVSAAIRAAPVRDTDKAVLGHIMLVAFIALIGWTVMRVLQIAADVYLRRYSIDVEDNLLARKHVTQIRILLRAATVLLVLMTIAAILMTFQGVRQYGVSLLAAGGAAGIVVGLAAQPVLSNLLAGIQIAITQPMRIEDAVVVEGEGAGSRRSP